MVWRITEEVHLSSRFIKSLFLSEGQSQIVDKLGEDMVLTHYGTKRMG